MGKSKAKIKQEFLFHLEHFYRNFGNQWSVDDFPAPLKSHREYLISILPELKEKGIIELNDDMSSFTIVKLPSQVSD